MDGEIIELLEWAQWMQSWGDIEVHLVKLPKIQGFVSQADSGTYYVFINSNLSIEKQRLVYYHEIKHIYDFIHSNVDKLECTIMEDDADEFADMANEVAASIEFLDDHICRNEEK